MLSLFTSLPLPALGHFLLPCRSLGSRFWTVFLALLIPLASAQADAVKSATPQSVVELSSAAIERPLKVSLSVFPPYTYTDAQGEIKGQVVTVFRALFDKLQWQYSMSFKPMARIHHKLKLGEIDIWAGPLGVPALDGHVYEAALPDSFGLHLYLWHRHDSAPVTDVLQLQGKTLAVVNGLTYRGLIDRITNPAYGINVFRASSHDSAFKMLIGKRTDYLLGYEQPMRESMNQHPEIKLLRHSLQTRRVGFIISRKAPQSRLIHSALLDAIAEHFDDGKRDNGG